MDRRYRANSGQEIRTLIVEHWDDFWELGQLSYEVQFRSLIKEEQRAALIERLVELGVQGARGPVPTPGFDYPTTDVVNTRRLSMAALGAVDWQETGLLSLSGYRVGRTQGESSETRRKTLNYIFLKDDLSDIEDRDYAESWGRPSTADRLRKLAETLAAFARNGRRNPTDMSQAISEWDEDLVHLKEQFYDRWGDFPWPNVDSG